MSPESKNIFPLTSNQIWITQSVLSFTTLRKLTIKTTPTQNPPQRKKNLTIATTRTKLLRRHTPCCGGSMSRFKFVTWAITDHRSQPRSSCRHGWSHWKIFFGQADGGFPQRKGLGIVGLVGKVWEGRTWGWKKTWKKITGGEVGKVVSFFVFKD